MSNCINHNPVDRNLDDSFCSDIAGYESNDSTDESDDDFSNDKQPWTKCSNFRSPVLDYRDVQGPLFIADDFSELDFFRQFFSTKIVDHILMQTNLYRKQCGKSKDVTKTDFLKYTALQIAIALAPRPRMDMYWSSDWVYGNAYFSTIMKRDDFMYINSVLHFNDNDLRDNDAPDPIHKVRPIVDLFNESFKQYRPAQEVAIDESMCAYKGRIHFLQFIPSKRTRFGIKFWVLSESKSGYILKLSLYTGKASDIQPVVTREQHVFGLGESVVIHLLRDYFNSGNIVYLDNFYSTPALFHYLYQRGIGATGTVRFGRRGLPDDATKPIVKKMDKNKPKFFKHKEYPTLICVLWRDKKPVVALSTVSDSSVVEKDVRSKDLARRRIIKPSLVDEYNQFMGGVDLGDQKAHSYSYPHKSKKWPTTIYQYLKERCLLNALVACNWVRALQNKPLISSLQFHRNIATQLLSCCNIEDSSLVERNSLSIPTHIRFDRSKDHYPQRTHFALNCYVCSRREKKRVRSSYRCETCCVVLCVSPCFKQYHQYH